MEKQNEEQTLDYALKVLAYPELEATETFSAWIRQKDNRQLYSELKAAYDGLALNEASLPDVQKEWERFLQANNHVTTHQPVSFTPPP